MNTFLLGWMVEKITGMPFQDAFTREVWMQIGAEADATFFAGRYGVPLTHGGFTSSLRDLARAQADFKKKAFVGKLVVDVRKASD